MKNNLTALNNYLFETLERLSDDSLDSDQFQREIERSRAVTSVAETVIHNGELSLKAIKYADEYGCENTRDKPLPPQLETDR